ncbi:MAG: A/G-specific adenine glycosylase [Chromatiales bacterium]|nr:A/G-specific adenine glycosylase [Chromatiales bacterium]
MAAPTSAERRKAAALAPLLLSWWARHGRHDLPWQQPATPWRVWVSEVMLQQTQVATVLDYFPRFIARFPGAVSLADAPVDDVLHLWSGLGYYARARNLHRAAGIVRDLHGGEVPLAFEPLVALPGVGRSTAGAILALAGGQRAAILDGNVKRVLARVFAVSGWPGAAAVGHRLWVLAEACTPDQQVGQYTQAIMDLGATLCTRRRPRCGQCPFGRHCAAREAREVEAYPAPRPRRERPRRETVMLLVRDADGAVLLERRPDSGLWGGLWSLPELEDAGQAAEWCSARLGLTPERLVAHPPLRHAFTHFELGISPLELRIATRPGAVMEGERWLWYKSGTSAKVGLAAPVSRLLASIGA